MPYHPKVLLTVGICLLLAPLFGCGASGDAGPPSASIAAGDTTLTDADGEPLDRPVRVEIKTSLGTLTVELDRASAPLSVANFLGYANRGAYEQTIFHQVDRGFMALAGGYQGDMAEVPADLPVRNEAHNGLRNTRGTIAMARNPAAIDSASSQFFFNLADNPTLDYQGEANYGYCVFGHVTAGLDVLDRIAEVPVQNRDGFDKLPVKQVVIESIRRVR